MVVLAYALAGGHDDLHLAVLPTSVGGAVIATYHSYLQAAGGSTCGTFACATVPYRLVGPTLPNQSLLAFLLVTGPVAGGAALQRRV